MKTTGHSLKNLGPYQKTLRPPGVPSCLRTLWKSRHKFRSTFHIQTGRIYWHVIFPMEIFFLYHKCLYPKLSSRS